MRKKPKCSVNAALRMQEIKKEQELEMLRFHIVKACLFKKKHNPQTAPIRIDELKELAKYWKLHRTRGFWRDHPEKEDLVRALTEHVKDKFGTADTETVTEMRFNDASQYVSHTSNAKAQMFENYTGDLFGTRGDYNNGMIYLSRMIKPDEESGRSEFADGLPALSGTEDNPNGMNAALFDEQRLQQEERRQVEAQNHREMRRKTAQSLYNLSCHAGTEIKILAEGGMGALLSLASFDDIETNRYCSAALVNLTCDKAQRQKMIEQGVLNALFELAGSPCAETRHNAAIGLCRLSFDEPSQSRLVTEGAFPALHSILNNCMSDETQVVCLKALINLSSLPGSTFSEGIMVTLVSLSPVVDTSTQMFCANAILNLSILPSSRVNIVEDGAITVLNNLANASTARPIHDLLCKALFNISSVRVNQELMTKQGATETIDKLLDEAISASSLKSVEEISLILLNLCCCVAIQDFLVSKGTVFKLLKIQNMEESTATMKGNVAQALANLSNNNDSRPALVKEGACEALIKLLNETDIITAKQDATVALCNMLNHPSNFGIMVEQGVVPALVELSNSKSPKIKEVCGLALFNMSCEPDMRVKITNQGIVGPLMKLLQLENETLQHQCIGALYNLSLAPETRTKIVEEKGVTVLVQLLEKVKITEIRIKCASILHNLSLDDDLRKIMVDQGAVDAIVKHCKADTIDSAMSLLSNDHSRLFCAGTLCNLSMFSMHISGLLSAIIALAHGSNADVTIRCAMSFSRMSSDEKGRELMAQSTSVCQGLNGLMRSGHEETQFHSAIAMCNIASVADPKLQGWKHKSAVADFIVIALLRVNSETTKQVCAKALFNFMTHPDCREQMLDEGVLYALIKLAKLENQGIRHLCVKALYNMSIDEGKIVKLLEMGVVRVLAKMGTGALECTNDLKKDIIFALSNLSAQSGNEGKLVEDGVIPAVKALVKLRDLEIRVGCATLLRNLSCQPQISEAMVKEKVVATLIVLSRTDNDQLRRLAMMTLCNFCTLDTVFPTLLKEGVITCLIDTLRKNSSAATSKIAARALQNLSFDFANQVQMVEEEAVPVLAKLLDMGDDDPETAGICAKILCLLSGLLDQTEQLVKHKIVEALVTIAKIEACTERNECMVALCNISVKRECLETMGMEGAVEAIVLLARPGDGVLSEDFKLRCSATLRNLSCLDTNRVRIAAQIGAMGVLMELANSSDAETRENCAVALYNMSSHKISRREMLQRGGVDVLISLSKTARTAETKQVTAVTLHALSSDGVNITDGMQDGGVVSSLLEMMDLDKQTIMQTKKLAHEPADMIPSAPLVPKYIKGCENPSKLKKQADHWTVHMEDCVEAELGADALNKIFSSSTETFSSRPAPYDTIIGKFNLMEDKPVKRSVEALEDANGEPLRTSSAPGRENGLTEGAEEFSSSMPKPDTSGAEGKNSTQRKGSPQNLPKVN